MALITDSCTMSQPPSIVLQVICLSDPILWIYLSLLLYNHKWFDLIIAEWFRGFPYFLQFKSEFSNKDFMILATVSSQPCFFWLYRASPSLAAENIINLILVLTIWWCPCVEFSLVLLEEGVFYDHCFLLTKICWHLPCFILFSKAKFTCYSRYLLTYYFCIPVCCDEKDIIFGGGVSSRKSYRFSYKKTLYYVQFQLLQHYCLWHRLGLLWYWMVCLGNEER